MKRHYAMLAVALAVVAMAGGAQALIVSGTIYAIDRNGDGQLNDYAEDTSTIDYIQFDVTAAGTVTFDVLAWDQDLNGDLDSTYLDSHIYLCSMDGSILAQNDIYFGSEGLGDGSTSDFDAYLAYDFSAAGSYVMAIGEYIFSSDELLSGINDSLPYDPNSPFGFGNALGDADYRLTITGNVAEEYSVSNEVPFGQSEVPEPASLTLLGLGLAGWAIRRHGKTA